MKKLILIILVCLGFHSCEFPPDNIFGLDIHAHRLDITNYYVEGRLLVQGYHLWKECDTCDVLIVIDFIRANRDSFKYGDFIWYPVEPGDFVVKLTPDDSTLLINTQYVNVPRGIKKHIEVIIE